MANKSTGKNYVSKGERKSSMSTRNVGVTEADKMNRKMKALRRGKRVVMTIANPNKAETNKPFIRVAYDYKNNRGTVIS